MAATDVRRVFVYGSLMWQPSLLRTLIHRSAPPAATPCVLDGWERAWNVVSARTFALADDPTATIHRRLVLGLRPRPGARCEGIALEFAPQDLAALAPREAAYELVDVSEVDVGGERVHTFVPRPDRTLGAHPVDEPLVVEQAYLDECRAGIAHHQLAEAGLELDRSLAGLRIARAADHPTT